ncbi:hypothetical protein NBRC116583_18870 [Arenicella sp. 4NH20-0111]|uniref:DUF3622 domain-containing protein n=1 Tax=Arenicella sp. 4NH20-0111 TaxID=3127648 RepID=UPI003107CC00
MAKTRKYSSVVEQQGATWRAQIHRQVTSRTTVISKENAEFSSEAAATEWAQEQLKAFTSTQAANNERHGAQRKLNVTEKSERSARRAEKTLQSKEKAAELSGDEDEG